MVVPRDCNSGVKGAGTALRALATRTRTCAESGQSGGRIRRNYPLVVYLRHGWTDLWIEPRRSHSPAQRPRSEYSPERLCEEAWAGLEPHITPIPAYLRQLRCPPQAGRSAVFEGSLQALEPGYDHPVRNE